MNLTPEEISALEDCINTRDDDGYDVSIARRAFNKINLESTGAGTPEDRVFYFALRDYLLKHTSIVEKETLEFSVKVKRDKSTFYFSDPGIFQIE